MKNAELVITIQSFSGAPSAHLVAFDSVEFGKSEFNRIEGLLKKRADKGNDLPNFLLVEGINKLTCNFDHICAVAFLDLAYANEQERGVKEAFPYLFHR